MSPSPSPSSRWTADSNEGASTNPFCAAPAGGRDLDPDVSFVTRPSASSAASNDRPAELSSDESSSSSDSSVPSCDTDDPRAEHEFYIRTILDELTKISLAVRRGGAKYRVDKVYSELDEKEHEPFRKHLTSVILASFKDPQARYLTPVQKMLRVSDETRLSDVQLDLVKTNILRRDRMGDHAKEPPAMVARPDAGAHELDKNMNPVEPPPDSTTMSTIRQGPSTASVHRQSQQKSSAGTTSSTFTTARTATAIDSQLESKDLYKSRGSSRITKVTRIAASQASKYPRCPQKRLDLPLTCPFCNELLPSEYSHDEASWRYEFRLPCIHDGAPVEANDITELMSPRTFSHIRALLVGAKPRTKCTSQLESSPIILSRSTLCLGGPAIIVTWKRHKRQVIQPRSNSKAPRTGKPT